MDFEEWWDKNGELYRRPTPDERYLFESGQQSKQAEIDALKAKINEAKEEINSFFDNQTQRPTDREYCNKLADILELLK